MSNLFSDITLQNWLSIIAIAVSLFTFFFGLRSKRKSDQQAKEQDKIKNDIAKQANNLNEQANEQAKIKNDLAEQANKLALMISGKEHEMSESLKYEVLELVSVIKVIDSKIDYNEENNDKIDYSQEIETLKGIQLRPGYLLLLKAIDYNRDKSRIDRLMQRLTSSMIQEQETRRLCQEILITISRVNLDEIIKQIRENYHNNWNEMVKELCLLSRFSYNKKNMKSRFDEAFYSFLKDEKGLALPNINKWDSNYSEKIEEVVRPYHINSLSGEDTPYLKFIGGHIVSFVKYLIIAGKLKESVPERIVREIEKGIPLSEDVIANIDAIAANYAGRSIDEIYYKYADEYDNFIFHQMSEKDRKKTMK